MIDKNFVTELTIGYSGLHAQWTIGLLVTVDYWVQWTIGYTVNYWVQWTIGYSGLLGTSHFKASLFISLYVPGI